MIIKYSEYKIYNNYLKINLDPYFNNLDTKYLQIFNYLNDKPILDTNIKNIDYSNEKYNLNLFFQDNLKKKLILLFIGVGSFQIDRYLITLINHLTKNYSVLALSQKDNPKYFHLLGCYEYLEEINQLKIFKKFQEIFIISYSGGSGNLYHIIKNKLWLDKIKGVFAISIIIKPYWINSGIFARLKFYQSLEKKLNIQENFNKNFYGDITLMYNFLLEKYHQTNYQQIINNYHHFWENNNDLSFPIIILLSKDDDFFELDNNDIKYIKNNLMLIHTNKGYHCCFYKNGNLSYLPFIDRLLNKYF